MRPAFKIRPKKTALLALVMMALSVSGCQSTYYSAMEKIGFEKRDLLASRVKDVKQSHKKAQKEFESAYDEFSALVNFDGGNLERQYNRLKDRYDDAVERKENVQENRERVETVGKALFKEWRAEIKLYTNSKLKASSSEQLAGTEKQFKRLVAQLKATESKMPPVLERFQDRVLFLKHNLNARSVTAMRSDNMRIQQDIRNLVIDMQASIDEADVLIAEMGL